jgi:ABC-type multidrug transport system ATPase subunit
MLALGNVSKTYPGHIQALSDINLEIGPGMFGLLGPNGAGKSTLMRTIATLQEADSGTLVFDGMDITANKTALRRMLGYLPQEFGAYPRTSAEAMLRHFAALKGIYGSEQKQAVESLLVQTNLWDARKRSVDKFSGGMKQRFGIAQALLGDPQLIIVDEPTAGLDPGERRRFQNLLAEIGSDRVVILSTHIVDDVAELCSRVAIMGKGRILRQGTPDELVAAMTGKIWVLLTDKENLPALRERVQVISTRFRAGRIEVRALSDTQPDGFNPAPQELEDVYFSTLVGAGLVENLE